MNSYSTRHKKIIEMANELADLTTESQEHFSFILKRNKIICFGKNKKYCTHPTAHKFDCRFNAIHSELAAIKAFPYPIRELKNFDLLNLRLNRKREIMLARPCKKCQNMLRFFEIENIWYTNSVGEFEYFVGF